MDNFKYLRWRDSELTIDSILIRGSENVECYVKRGGLFLRFLENSFYSESQHFKEGARGV